MYTNYKLNHMVTIVLNKYYSFEIYMQFNLYELLNYKYFVLNKC